MLPMLSTIATLLVGSSFTFAQTLQDVTDFGPVYETSLTMKIYVPSELPSNPAILLALHGCGGSGQQYFSSTKYTGLADAHGVILIYPSTPKDSNCWDNHSNKSLSHGGHGDTEVLINMVDYIVDEYNADANRVFVVGTSSGCMMTNSLSATYPDRVAAVSCYSGVAAGCLAGQKGSSPISSDRECSNGNVQKTGEEWAKQVHAMYPGYDGNYPRFLTWHGNADTLVFYQNLIEQLKEWSTIQGVEFSKNETDTPEKGYTKMVYGDGTKLVGISADGVGHVVPNHEEEDFKWFGLI
ncbi:hypothetical protein V2G26_015679 [Clonostachys chloroleuca]